MIDTLSASQLHLAGNNKLSARDVFNLNGKLKAELVFLNACQSGVFHQTAGSETGGFWQAFLHAGASSLLTTVAFVHPCYAQQLAQKFYLQWFGGASKAEALRRAQLKMRKKGIASRHWASHILIGNPR